jgi:hypothetical protein
MILRFYLFYHILIAAKKGLKVGKIIYGHNKFFPGKIHSYFVLQSIDYSYVISVFIISIDKRTVEWVI